MPGLSTPASQPSGNGGHTGETGALSTPLPGEEGSQLGSYLGQEVTQLAW